MLAKIELRLQNQGLGMKLLSGGRGIKQNVSFGEHPPQLPCLGSRRMAYEIELHCIKNIFKTFGTFW
jgi:hypothetical protein